MIEQRIAPGLSGTLHFKCQCDNDIETSFYSDVGYSGAQIVQICPHCGRVHHFTVIQNGYGKGKQDSQE